MFKVPEEFRVKNGPLGSGPDAGNNGLFIVKAGLGVEFLVIASDGMGWEHVSVSRPDRTPTWGEMCLIKDMFWGEQDLVVQYHPPKQSYVNNHPYCLHLWRPVGVSFPAPPSILVGIFK